MVYVPGSTAIENVPSGLLTDVLVVGPLSVMFAFPSGLPPASVILPVMLLAAWASKRTGAANIAASALINTIETKKYRSFKRNFLLRIMRQAGENSIEFSVGDSSG
jgi:hypothetical protein